MLLRRRIWSFSISVRVRKYSCSSVVAHCHAQVALAEADGTTQLSEAILLPSAPLTTVHRFRECPSQMVQDFIANAPFLPAHKSASATGFTGQPLTLERPVLVFQLAGPCTLFWREPAPRSKRIADATYALADSQK
jgi:hypothetical protein